MAKVTGQMLWDFCEDLHSKGAGYVWGARGNVYDEAEAQYLYKCYGSGTYNEKYYMITSMSRWKGKIVVDCSGLIQAFRRAKFDGKDNTANGLYDECPKDKRGTIDTLPKNLRGVLLFKKSGSRMGHVGVYGGNNTTIEAANSNSGVVKRNPMITSCWTHWGIPSWLEATDMTSKPAIDAKPSEDDDEVIATSSPLKVCKIGGCYRLNVRNGSSVSHKSIGTLAKNDIVEVYAIKGNWAKISDKEEKWCSVKYLRDLTKFVVSGCTFLNVRKGPGTKYGSVRTLKQGDVVWGYDVADNGWVKISEGNEYASGKYLKVTK